MRTQPFHSYANGDVYTGELQGLARHGAGECKYGGGASVYQGQWEADRHEGQGRLSSRRGVFVRGVLQVSTLVSQSSALI